MKHCKKCPTCGHANASDDVLCFACMADISSVTPTAEGSVPAEGPPPAANAAVEASGAADVADVAAAPDAPANEAVSGEPMPTVRDAAPLLKLRYGDTMIDVEDGAILGRFERGFLFLAPVTTVSRRHAQFSRSISAWTIEDLASTNGTFVNGVRLLPGKKHPLRAGDRLGFSSKIEVEVAGD